MRLLRMPSAPEAQPARAALRGAQEVAGTARKRAQAAAGAAERARAAVDRARAALAAYDGVDERVAQHRAAALRAGQAPAGLPPDLVAARAEQDAAQRELQDATAAAELLEDESRQARDAAEQADAEVRAAADQVRVDVAMTMLHELAAAETEAARRRATLAGLLSSRTASDPALRWEIAGLIHDPLHTSLIDRAPPGAGDPGIWVSFGQRLMADAGAEFGGGRDA